MKKLDVSKGAWDLPKDVMFGAERSMSVSGPTLTNMIREQVCIPCLHMNVSHHKPPLLFCCWLGDAGNTCWDSATPTHTSAVGGATTTVQKFFQRHMVHPTAYMSRVRILEADAHGFFGSHGVHWERSRRSFWFLSCCQRGRMAEDRGPHDQDSCLLLVLCSC